jgi:hypothetical protein
VGRRDASRSRPRRQDSPAESDDGKEPAAERPAVAVWRDVLARPTASLILQVGRELGLLVLIKLGDHAIEGKQGLVLLKGGAGVSERVERGVEEAAWRRRLLDQRETKSGVCAHPPSTHSQVYKAGFGCAGLVR